MQAVILAAGFGSRLSKVSNGMPKCLLPIGGRPLIEHQLDALSEVGIGKVLVVIGHEGDKIRAQLGNKVDYIENTVYGETNSLYSLSLAKDWITGPFVLLNCDILFHPTILDRLVAKGGNTLAFDSTSTRAQEQTKVVVTDGKVVDLGKDISPELARGESLGMIRFDKAGGETFMNTVSAMAQNGSRNSWVIEAIRSVCTKLDMRSINVAGLPWTEIDFPNDLERARDEVWPAINKESWKKTIRWKKTRYVAIALMIVFVLIADKIVDAQIDKSNKKTVEWTNETPKGGDKVSIKLPKGKQRWWASTKGSPLSVTMDGPIEMRIEMRLVLPEGATEPGRYVAEIKIDEEPYTWMSFKSTPHPLDKFSNGLVGDRDRIKITVPEGHHTVSVDLLAGTSDKFLARFRYPEPISQEE